MRSKTWQRGSRHRVRAKHWVRMKGQGWGLNVLAWASGEGCLFRRAVPHKECEPERPDDWSFQKSPEIPCNVLEPEEGKEGASLECCQALVLQPEQGNKNTWGEGNHSAWWVKRLSEGEITRQGVWTSKFVRNSGHIVGSRPKVRCWAWTSLGWPSLRERGNRKLVMYWKTNKYVNILIITQSIIREANYNMRKKKGK